MATYYKWSESYFNDLTIREHNVNNQWFNSMLNMLKEMQLDALNFMKTWVGMKVL